MNEHAQKAAAQEAGLTKFDPAVLKGMESGALVAGSAVAFQPATMGEAMELAKLMASSNFMPKHLRGVPGDCLAVVLQSMRWGMDPFAVGNKTYFVNDRMAYEAQLVNAVVNTSRILEGRLQIEWDGEGEQLICKVTGKIKGDPVPKVVWQEIKTIATKNSPLWKSSPRQQLGYYTSRLWGRLHTPEVLMGVYTPDELEGEERQADGSYLKAPARPTRDQVRAGAAQARAEAAHMDEQFRGAVGPAGGQASAGETPPAEPEQTDRTGAQGAGEQSAGDQPGEGEAREQSADGAESEARQMKAIDELTALIIGEINGQGFLAGIDGVLEKYGSDLDYLKEIATAKHEEIVTAVNGKRERLKSRGRSPR